MDVLNLETYLKCLGRKVKVARKAKGLSQVNAAHTIGVDYRHYQNIEGGKINVRLNTLLLLAEFYGLPIEPSAVLAPEQVGA